MGKYRPRFNAKARSGMISKQQILKKARNKHLVQEETVVDGENEVSTSEIDTNPEILVPLTQEEKEIRKRKLSEFLKPKESKLSASKKKRLDKYIDKQIKKQEKENLLSKISKSNIDTSQMISLKSLGTGRQTKKEQMVEALKLEQAGRGDDMTKEILYQEREIKDWKENEVFKEFLNTENSSSADKDLSSFIDHRPQNGNIGFGFKNLEKVEKSIPKRKYNWRQRLEREKARKHGKEMDDESEESDEKSRNESQNKSSDDQIINDESEEEFTGFDSDVNEVSAPELQDSDQQSHSNSEYDSDSDSSSIVSDAPKPKSSSIFKQWVTSFTEPKPDGVTHPQFNGHYTPIERPEDQDELPQEIAHEFNPSRKAFYVHVTRSEEIQSQRLQLPVCGEEQRIMEALNNNDCVVICGETGSGKTTQVPQFLFEAGYGNPDSPETSGMIGITQPRRVAAVSMARRVGEELGDHGRLVGYQIRFDSKVSDDTRVKFMTDGVLLRELMTDLTLSKYSVIIIDEAHERNVNTDILIGVLSRVLKLRRENGGKPLKLIIMSATLRINDFTENKTLFKQVPPVLKVNARQFPVAVHFSRRTKFEYIEEAYDKAVKIHERLPPGGILIFMTGQNEISQLVKRLRTKFPSRAKLQKDSTPRVRVDAQQSTIEAEEVELGDEQTDFDEIEKLEADLDTDDYESESEEGFEEAMPVVDASPLHVLPLYSMLPTDEQMKVFQDPPQGSRFCVVATNVAETSLTIPNIRYVVDCGRVKERHYDEETKVQSFRVNWTSKASADQRAGRAGRTGPGHCYRLYSSAVYEADFEQFTKPEILRMPIEGLVLQMKAMGIDNIINFPFPTAPSKTNLSKGLMVLKYLRALDSKGQLTSLGRAMSSLPLSPRYAKMVSIGDQMNCLPYVLALVSVLSVGDPFLNEQELGITEMEDDDSAEKEERRAVRSQLREAHSKFNTLNPVCDAFKLLSAVCAHDYITDSSESFCREHFLRFKTMQEIKKLRQQIGHIISVYAFPRDSKNVKQKLLSKLSPPSSQQLVALRQMIAAGFTDQIAVRADIIDLGVSARSKKHVSTYPYKTVFPVIQRTSSTENLDPYVYIHSSSMINNSGKIPPEYLVFEAIQQSQNHKEGQASKIRIKPLVNITASELSNLAKDTALITYSKPLGPPYAPRNISSIKRECWVVPRFGAALGLGGVGWDLPARKVIQNKEGSEWIVASYL